MNELLAEYFEKLIKYQINSPQEPLWLYRLLELQRQQIYKKFKIELDSKKQFIEANEWRELDDLQFLILCIVWKDEEKKSFSQLDLYCKLRLLNIATSNQHPIIDYATSLLITFMLRDYEESHRELALQLLKEKDVTLTEDLNQTGKFILAGSQAEKIYRLNGHGNIFKHPLTRPFVDLSYADFKGLSSDIKGMNFSCQYMLGLKAEGVVFKKNIFEDAYLGLANFSSATFEVSATFKATECNRAVFPRAQFKDTSIINSHFRGVHFQEGCLTYLGDPKPAFKVLSETKSLAGSCFSEQALSTEEYQKLQQLKKEVFERTLEEKEERIGPFERICEYTQELVQRERIPLEGPPQNWPKDPAEWRYGPSLNWPKDAECNANESKICTLNESPLLNLLRFTVHATSDHFSYRSMRFEFSRTKKAFDAAKFGEFLAQEIISPPQHPGEAASITIQQVKVVNDPVMWSKYQALKAELKKTFASSTSRPLQEVKWHGGKELPHKLPVLDDSVGECWLFHATSQEVMQKICKTGFSLAYCKSRIFAGYGALGKGIYLTDMFSKAAIYVTCPNPDCMQNQCKCSEETKKKYPKALFLVRVLLGRPFLDKHKSRKYKDTLPEGYHSSWGPAKEFVPDSEFDCNEFIVTDAAQLYPEFCIYYVDNLQVKNELSSKNSLVRQTIEGPSELKQIVNNYHRYLVYGTLDQQFYQLNKLEDWISDYLEEIRNKPNQLQAVDFFNLFLQEIKKEALRLNPQIRHSDKIIEDDLQKELPSLPFYYDAWVYSGLGIDYPPSYVMDLCVHFLNHYRIEPPKRRAYFYQQLGLAHFQDENPFEVIKNFNEAWLLFENESKDVKTHLFSPKLCEECYFELSLKLLKSGSDLMPHRTVWVERVAKYYVDRLIQDEWSFEEFTLHYWQIKAPADIECFRSQLMTSVKIELSSGHLNTDEKKLFYSNCINLPNHKGIRDKKDIDQTNWSLQWEKILLPYKVESDVKVFWMKYNNDTNKFEVQKERYLNRNYISYLFHTDNSPLNGQPSTFQKVESGRSLTVLLKDQNDDPLVFMKFFPRHPLRQHFITLLAQHLSGYSVMSTLVRIQYKDQESYPVLISEPLGDVKNEEATVAQLQDKGLGLEDRYEKLLDGPAFFWKYLEAQIFSGRDDKNDNLSFVLIAFLKKYQLISIDPDETLENEWASGEGVKLFSLILLLHLAHKKEGWSSSVSKQYQALNLEELLDDCLCQMQIYCQGIQELFAGIKISEKIISEDKKTCFDNHCNITNFLRDDDLPRLYERMKRLKKVLERLEASNDPEKLIPHKILEKMDSLLAYYYDIAYQKGNKKTLSERFMYLKGVNKNNFELTTHVSKSNNAEYLALRFLTVPADNAPSTELVLPTAQTQTVTKQLTKTTPPDKQNPLLSVTLLGAQHARWRGFVCRYSLFEMIYAEVKRGDFERFKSKEISNHVREKILSKLVWDKSVTEKLLPILKSYALRYLRLYKTPVIISENNLVEAVKSMSSLVEVRIEECETAGVNLLIALSKLSNLMILVIVQMKLNAVPVLSFANLQKLSLRKIYGIKKIELNASQLKELIVNESDIEAVILNGKTIEVKHLNEFQQLVTDSKIESRIAEEIQNVSRNYGRLDPDERKKATGDFNKYFSALIDNSRMCRILENIAIHRLVLPEQSADVVMLDAMLRLKSFTVLKLDGFTELEYENLKTLITNSTSLKTLSLDGCKKIDDTLLSLIGGENCPQLENLNLSGTSITKLNGGLWGLFEKVWLISLTIKNCRFLSKIKVKATHLSNLNLANNPNLKELEIVSDDIQLIDLSKNPRLNTFKVAASNLNILVLPIDAFNPASLDEPAYPKINLQCPNLHLVHLLEDEQLNYFPQASREQPNDIKKLTNLLFYYTTILFYYNPSLIIFISTGVAYEKSISSNIVSDLPAALEQTLKYGYCAEFNYLISTDKTNIFNKENFEKLKNLCLPVAEKLNETTKITDQFAHELLANIKKIIQKEVLDHSYELENIAAYCMQNEMLKYFISNFDCPSIIKDLLNSIIDRLITLITAPKDRLITLIISSKDQYRDEYRVCCATLLSALGRYVSTNFKLKLKKFFDEKINNINEIDIDDMSVFIELYDFIDDQQLAKIQNYADSTFNAITGPLRQACAIWLAKYAFDSHVRNMKVKVSQERLNELLEAMLKEDTRFNEDTGSLFSKDKVVISQSLKVLVSLLTVKLGSSEKIKFRVKKAFEKQIKNNKIDGIHACLITTAIDINPSLFVDRLYKNFIKVIGQPNPQNEHLLLSLLVISEYSRKEHSELIENLREFWYSVVERDCRDKDRIPNIPDSFIKFNSALMNFKAQDLNDLIDQAMLVSRVAHTIDVKIYSVFLLVKLTEPSVVKASKAMQVVKLLTEFLADANWMLNRIAFFSLLKIHKDFMLRKSEQCDKSCGQLKILNDIGFFKKKFSSPVQAMASVPNPSVTPILQFE